MQEITTARLLLRPHRIEDFADCAAMWADTEVTRFIGGRPFTSEEVWARLLRYAGHWALHGWGYWVVRARDTGAFVGEIGFADFRRTLDPPFGDAPEIGWALVPQAQGRGLAREAVAAALRWGDANFPGRTVCMIRPDNARSLRLAGTLGFTRYAETDYHGSPTILLERPRPAAHLARGRAAVATANPHATEAALHMLAEGGSAVDAAIAVQAMLTLVEPNASGIGGGAMLLVHAEGAIHAIDGMSAAPARVTSRLNIDFDGRAIPSDRIASGGRTVGVPGALRALESAHRRFGRLPWARLFAPAIALAERGHLLSPYVERMLRELPAMRDEPMAQSILAGGVVRNPALATTLRAIAAGGADAFYTGDIARLIAEAVAADPFPGTLTVEDLAAYRAVERPAPTFPLGPFQVATAPLPAYGGIAAGQLVGILAALGMNGMGIDPTAEEIHLLAEAGRVAFADRDPYADPHFAPLDVARLLSPDYLARRAALVDPARRNDRIPAGHGDGDGTSMTSHVSIADGAGQVVSLTATINQNFGARISVGGFYLNNVLTNFAPDRRQPNAMAPLKRPRSSIAPMIVMDQGRPVAALGGGGGFRIIGTVANALLRLAAGMRDPQAMLAAPHALNWSGTTELEPPLAHHLPALAAKGHFPTIRRLDTAVQCVVADGDNWLAGADPRRDGTGGVLS